MPNQTDLTFLMPPIQLLRDPKDTINLFLGDQAFQGRQGEDVRGVIAVPPEPDQAQPGVQPHAERDQSHLPERDLCG